MKMAMSEVEYAKGQLEIMAAEQTASELLLPEWGRWKRRGNSLRHLDYPPCILNFRGRGSDASDKSAFIADITDEQGNRVELAVRSLPKTYRMVITALYLARVSVRELARQNRCTRGDIDHVHSVALGMLNEKLK